MFSNHASTTIALLLLNSWLRRFKGCIQMGISGSAILKSLRFYRCVPVNTRELLEILGCKHFGWNWFNPPNIFEVVMSFGFIWILLDCFLLPTIKLSAFRAPLPTVVLHRHNKNYSEMQLNSCQVMHAIATFEIPVDSLKC